MLTGVRIKDFGPFEAVAVEFGPGFNVVSGDEAAARTLIDAIGAALGGPVAADAVRPRASASLEARFALTAESPAEQWLRAQGLGTRDLVVTREVAADGRSRTRVNSREMPLEALQVLGDLLIEVNAAQGSGRLLRPSAQRDVLDAFGSPSLDALRGEIAERLERRQALRAEQQSLKDAERDRLKHIDILTQQVREIDAAAPQPGEDEALAARRARLLNAERLAASARDAYTALTEAEGQAATDPLGRAKAALRDVASVDPLLGRIADRLEALAGEFAQVTDELGQYVTGVEARPGELAAINHRLDVLRGLRQKYGDSVDAMLKFRAQASSTLSTLQGSDARGPQIASEMLALEHELADRCERLSVLRRETAARFAADVDAQLATLEMGRLRLTVTFARDPDPDGILTGDQRVAVGPAGADRVTFLLGGASGEAPKLIEQAVSGGDLARVLLTIRHVLAAAGGIQTMLSADIDEGVGTRTARALGQVLDAVARARQLICVTRLPQVACLAGRHVLVEKEAAGARGRVQVRALEAKDRVGEIARMLSGRMPATVAREYAAELLGRAQRTSAASIIPGDARGGKL
ncbi:MAG: DNA repair protein RecN [Armatimonadota bacterium]